jgi:hypothetical protein
VFEQGASQGLAVCHTSSIPRCPTRGGYTACRGGPVCGIGYGAGSALIGAPCNDCCGKAGFV